MFAGGGKGVYITFSRPNIPHTRRKVSNAQETDLILNHARGTQRRFLPKCTEKSFQAIQSTFRSLETHSKRRCKICICSVILGKLEAFRNYKGFSVIFPKILDAVERFTKVRIFLIPLSITFLNPKILGFLFLRKLA